LKKWRLEIYFKSKHNMPPKTGTKKSAKSEDDIKKKDTGKSSKKGAEDIAGNTLGSSDLGSALNDSNASKIPAANLIRGSSQLGTPLEESANKETGVSTSELSQHADGNRENGEGGINAGDNINGTGLSDADIKYEEPILPNLIVLRFGQIKIIKKL
jgi:hypothetical protein